MSNPQRILIVEDEPNVRLVSRTALVALDCFVPTASDGETALRWLEEEPFELIFLDLRMPELAAWSC